MAKRPNNLKNQKKFSSEYQPENRGNKKGNKHKSTIVKKWLSVKLTVENPLTGELQELEVEDQITLAQIQNAMEGDATAYKLLMDNAYPKDNEEKEDINEIKVPAFVWGKNEEKE